LRLALRCHATKRSCRSAVPSPRPGHASLTFRLQRMVRSSQGILSHSRRSGSSTARWRSPPHSGRRVRCGLAAGICSPCRVGGTTPHLCGPSSSWLPWASFLPGAFPFPASACSVDALAARPSASASRRPRDRGLDGVFAHAPEAPPFGLLSGTSGRSPSGFVTLYSKVSKNREIG